MWIATIALPERNIKFWSLRGSIKHPKTIILDGVRDTTWKLHARHMHLVDAAKQIYQRPFSPSGQLKPTDCSNIYQKKKDLYNNSDQSYLKENKKLISS